MGVCSHVGSIPSVSQMQNSSVHQVLRVEFLLRTDSGYPKDTDVALFTLANPENPFRQNAPRSALLVSALAHPRGPGARQAVRNPRAPQGSDQSSTDSNKSFVLWVFPLFFEIGRPQSFDLKSLSDLR